jgi:YHS domain-containing protein
MQHPTGKEGSMRTTALFLMLGVALAAPEGDLDPVRIPALVDLKNATCPVSGEAIEGGTHTDWNGVRVRLCCADCKGEFAKDPAAALGKLGLKVAKDADGKAVVDLANATCPIMGKPAKADVMGELDGVRVHYCCPGCDKKVKKDPAAAYAKLGYGYLPSVVDLRNRACPVSGKPAKDEVFADADGVRVHFCCPNCPKAFAKDPAAVFAKLGVDPAQVKEATK